MGIDRINVAINPERQDVIMGFLLKGIDMTGRDLTAIS
jgi:hypothetical protein